jgi:hypothetical protein
MTPLDHITAAVDAAYGTGRDSLITSYYLSCMDDVARLHFDDFLLQTNDPIVGQGGSTESRFLLRCLRDVERRRAAVSPQAAV